MPKTRGKDFDQIISDRVTVKKRHSKNKTNFQVEGNVEILYTPSTLDNTNHSTQSSLTIEGNSNDNIPSVIRYRDTYDDKVKGNIIFNHDTSNTCKLNVYNDSQVTVNTLELNESKTVVSANTEIGSSSANKTLQVYGNTSVSGTLTPTTLTLGSISNVESKLGDIDTAIAGKHPTISNATNLNCNSVVCHGNSFLTLEGSTENDFEATFQINDPTKDWSLTFPTPTGTTPSVLYDESSLDATKLTNTIAFARLPVGTTSTTVLQGDTTTITGTQASNITTNNSKVSFPGFGTSAGTALEGDTTTITGTQASNITTNNSKVSHPGFGTSAGTCLEGDKYSEITTNTTNISANTSKNVLEELILCPTTYDSSGDVEDPGSDINISTYVSRVPTGNTPTLDRLTAVQTLSSNDEVTIHGTEVLYYLPPSDTNHLTISYDLQLSYGTKTSTMFSAMIMASYNGGTYYPIFNSLRGVGQATAWRMETITLTATIHHNGTGTTESYINSGLLNINGLGASDFWSFKLMGVRYHGSSDWGHVMIHECNYANSYMWSSSYLSGTPKLSPPHIRITATK